MGVFDICVNLVENYIIYYFLSNFLTMNEKFNKYIYFGFIILSTMIGTCLNLVIGYEGVYIYLSTILSICFCLKYSSNRKLEIIFSCFLIFLLIILINGTLLVVLNSIIYNDIQSIKLMTSQYYWSVILFSKFFLLGICININKVKKYYNDIIINLEISIMFLFIIFISLIYLHFDNVIHSERFNSNIFVLGYLSLTILAISFIFGFFHLLNINKKMRNDEIKIVVQQNKIENVIEFNQMNEKLVGLKHDMKHILLYVDESLENDKVDDARRSIKDYNQRLDKVKILKITNSDVLNYTINHLASKCNKNNIELKYYVTSMCQFNLNDNDLMLILSNILENAYENCNGDKKINIEIIDKNDCIIITVINSIDIESMEINLEFKTTKSGNNHGYGIKNVRDIIEKNDGSLLFECNNYQFICKLIINNITN